MKWTERESRHSVSLDLSGYSPTQIRHIKDWIKTGNFPLMLAQDWAAIESIVRKIDADSKFRTASHYIKMGENIIQRDLLRSWFKNKTWSGVTRTHKDLTKAKEIIALAKAQGFVD